MAKRLAIRSAQPGFQGVAKNVSFRAEGGVPTGTTAAKVGAPAGTLACFVYSYCTFGASNYANEFALRARYSTGHTSTVRNVSRPTDFDARHSTQRSSSTYSVSLYSASSFVSYSSSAEAKS